MAILDISVYLIHLLFQTYTILLFLRIISSWFPLKWQMNRFVHFLAFYTEPYLDLFRRWIPPLGGVLDLSPIAAVFVLKLLEIFLIGLF